MCCCCAVLCCAVLCAVVLRRFQWWRDALSNLSPNTAPPQHPVLTALWDTLYSSSSSNSSSNAGSSKSSSKASIYQLKRMLDAREQDLLDPQPPLGLKDLETYGEATASQLLYLQLGAAGGLHIFRQASMLPPQALASFLCAYVRVVEWIPLRHAVYVNLLAAGCLTATHRGLSKPCFAGYSYHTNCSACSRDWALMMPSPDHLPRLLAMLCAQV
jgi:hypothetical protein